MVSDSVNSLSPGLSQITYEADWGTSGSTLRGSNVVPFLVMIYLLLRDYNILPKKELHSSLWATI